MKQLRERFEAITLPVISVVQHVISSPLWALGVIASTLGWMFYETHFAKNPIEGPVNGWAYTVLIYTLLSLWVENFMKVQQAIQSRMQQKQMDRIEFILRFLGEQSKTLQASADRNEERDRIIHHVVTITNKLAQGLHDIVEARKDIP